MHTNNAVRHKKNKHGRKGVTRATRNLPLAEVQAIQVKERAWKDGFRSGRGHAFAEALRTVNAAKNIRAARRAIEELADE